MRILYVGDIRGFMEVENTKGTLGIPSMTQQKGRNLRNALDQREAKAILR